MTQQMKSHPGMVENIIDMLKHMDIDGETMQYILEEVGMEEQMLKQLITTRFKDNSSIQHYLSIASE
jgi:hypothetical protein